MRAWHNGGSALTDANDDPTADLLIRLAAGERAALDRLWQMHARAVRAIGTRFLGTAEAGEDVLQDSFVKIWKNAGRFDPARGNGKTWLYAIVRNTARDHLRRQRLRWLVGLDDLAVPPKDPAPDQDERAEARAKLQAVQGEILGLPDAQRMTLLLSSVEALDTTEIAVIIGRSQGAVEQLIVRARRHLRARMKEIGYDDAE